MVAGRQANYRLIERVADIYSWLDFLLKENSSLAGTCNACGKCCDFESYDHRLFVSTPEMMYLFAKLSPENIKPMPTGRCPYNNTDGKCTIHEHRFASCRTFCCNGNADFESELGETAVKRFKLLCKEFQIPYRYCDLAPALNNWAG